MKLSYTWRMQNKETESEENIEKEDANPLSKFIKCFEGQAAIKVIAHRLLASIATIEAKVVSCTVKYEYE